MIKSFSIKTLKKLHYLSLAALFILVVSTPFIVRKGNYIFNEEVIESGLLVIIFISYFFVNLLYEHELNKKQEDLNESFKYIGQMNVKLEAIDFLGNSTVAIPTSKNELKEVFSKFSEIALGTVATPYVYYRIVEKISGKTLFEYSRGRNNQPVPIFEYSNKDLINGTPAGHCSVITSKYKNSQNTIYCILPVENISTTETTLLQALQNYLAAIYIIYGSQQTKDTVV
jgi:hypothetical protein